MTKDIKFKNPKCLQKRSKIKKKYCYRYDNGAFVTGKKYFQVLVTVIFQLLMFTGCRVK